jgi:hypothetical protein
LLGELTALAEASAGAVLAAVVPCWTDCPALTICIVIGPDFGFALPVPRSSRVAFAFAALIASVADDMGLRAFLGCSPNCTSCGLAGP